MPVNSTLAHAGGKAALAGGDSAVLATKATTPA
jgi:hypothetical protein